MTLVGKKKDSRERKERHLENQFRRFNGQHVGAPKERTERVWGRNNSRNDTFPRSHLIKSMSCTTNEQWPTGKYRNFWGKVKTLRDMGGWRRLQLKR